jgi:hypothetical protein
LEAEVDALGKRLEDVRESLAVLVEAAESKAANKDLCTDDLLQTKSYLSSVQQVRRSHNNKSYYVLVSCIEVASGLPMNLNVLYANGNVTRKIAMLRRNTQTLRFQQLLA